MSLSLWLAFTLAYAVMALMPGPVILLVVSYALTQGRRTALAVVAGTTLGDATCLAGAVLGLGALLAASATAFSVVKICGALYLVFLGVRMWRAPVAARGAEAQAPGGSGARVFVHAYLATALNPKSVLFFMVFAPQFMAPRAPLLPQLGAMLASVFVCGTLVDGGYTLCAASLRRFTRGTRRQRAVNRVAGGVLVGEGVIAAMWRGVIA